MLSYCLKYKNNTKSKNSWVKKTSSGEVMLFSKCALHNSTKSNIIKKQEALGLLNQLRIKTPLAKIKIESYFVLKIWKVNAIVNKILLAGDRFMPKCI